MIVACIAIPLLLALAGRWLPPYRATAPVCAGLTLACCLSLPWTGAPLGLWLVPDPLGVHVAVLACFAWLAAALLEDAVVPVLAGVAGCLNLALLSGSPELTVLAAGAAAIIAIVAQPGGASLPMTAAALGLAIFGVALLHPAGAAVNWATLAEMAQQSRGASLGVGVVLTLLGLGCTCLLQPLRAVWSGAVLPRQTVILAGPLGGVWLVVALRLRGVLDGNGHAIAPGGLLVGAGLVLIAVAVLGIRAGRDRVASGATLGVMGAAVFAFGLGDTSGTAAGLLGLTLGCLALVTAGAGGWVGTIGLAALAGVPPLGGFAAAYGVFGSALARSIPLAVMFGALDLALITAALRQLPAPQPGRTAPIGWAGLVLTIGASWALPPGVVAWVLGIAASAR